MSYSPIMRLILLTPSRTNSAPTNITLTGDTIAENAGNNAAVGVLSTTDQNAGDTHAYTLVAGDGSTHNAQFSISGASLRATSSLDYESGTTRSVRIRSTDNGGLWVEKQFTINITNEAEGGAFNSDDWTDGEPGVTSHIWELTFPESYNGVTCSLTLNPTGGGDLAATGLACDLDTAGLSAALEAAWGPAHDNSSVTIDGGVVTWHIELDSNNCHRSDADPDPSSHSAGEFA